MESLPPTSSPTSGTTEPGALASTGSELVLGYPEISPAPIELSPLSQRAGARPSALRKQNDSPRPVSRTGPPLPKRPKGRLLIGSAFLLALGFLATTLFESTLRYVAYGEVVGRRIDVSVRWPGIVRSIHVREGDLVAPGDLIATIDSLEMRQKIDEIDDELRLERAKLASELAMLRWEAEKIRDTRKLSLSEFYDKWSELLWEQSRLADLRMQVKRIEPVYQEGAASAERMESLRFQLAGQEKRVEQLTEAVRALQQRSEDSPIKLELEDRVQPTLTRIENLQTELQRTRELIREGEVRAPAAGRVVRTCRFAGEYADMTTPIAELYVEGSTELVVYVPQDAVKDYPIGKTVTLHVSPIDTNLICRVERVALEMRTAPASLQHYYRSHESLLPVYLRVNESEGMTPWLALGSEVRIPRCDDVTALAQLKKWWNGWDASPPVIPNPLRPDENLSPVRTVAEQDPPTKSDDKKLLGRDGRTAGWIRQP